MEKFNILSVIMDETHILSEIKKACKRAGGPVAYAKKLGISTGWISDYLSERKKIKNMTLGTLFKIFPSLVIYFSDDLPSSEINQYDSSEYSSNSLQKALQEAESKKHEYEKKLAELEKERHIFELEKENWKLKRDLEEARNAEMKKGMRSPFSRQ